MINYDDSTKLFTKEHNMKKSHNHILYKSQKDHN